MTLDADEETLTEYLLGELSEDEQEQVEMRYLSDPEVYESLILAEDRLIDSYVRKALPAARRERFENHFLRSPERRQRVEFANAWLHYISRSAGAIVLRPGDGAIGAALQAPPPGRRLAWAAAAAMLVLVIGGTWLLSRTLKVREELGRSVARQQELEREQKDLQQRVEQTEARNDELSRELEAERSLREQLAANQPPQRPPLEDMAVFTLGPGLLRGEGGTNQFSLPAAKKWVQLKARFNDSRFQRYTATITTPDGEVVESKHSLTARRGARSKTLSIKIPASRLAEGDYILSISGEAEGEGPKDVGKFSFAIIKK